MDEDYKYDVFLSYLHTNLDGREAASSIWVRKYFYPELKRWLPHYASLARQTQVFLDDSSIQLGTERSIALQQALQTSRCLLAVLSQQYFCSTRCLTELSTMREREKLLGLRIQTKPSGLIYAVIFSGTEEDFAEVTKTAQTKDLRNFAFTSSAFKDSSIYGSFQNAMQEVCQELSKMILAAPTWDKNWPVVIPEQAPAHKRVALPQP